MPWNIRQIAVIILVMTFWAGSNNCWSVGGVSWLDCGPKKHLRVMPTEGAQAVSRSQMEEDSSVIMAGSVAGFDLRTWDQVSSVYFLPCHTTHEHPPTPGHSPTPVTGTSGDPSLSSGLGLIAGSLVYLTWFALSIVQGLVCLISYVWPVACDLVRYITEVIWTL